VTRAPRVAYQGEPGAYGEDAIRARFGSAAVPVPLPGFADVVAAVETGAAEYGVLPLVNSIVGVVQAARQALDGASVREIGRVEVPVRHCLMAVAGARIAGLLRVESHPVALAQCGRYLATIRRVTVCPVQDTAGAARSVAESGDPTRAAIASARAARLHGLVVLARDIADTHDNLTTFSVLRAESRPVR
jgi:prephenate dehydratase